MKISSLQENLKKSLLISSRIAGKNVNLPILNNIKIEALNGNIKLFSTDLEIGIICSVRGKVEEEGEYTIDSKIFSDFIALLPNKKVNLKKKEHSINIECDNYKTSINGQDADEYPLIPQVEKNEVCKININEFKKALSQVVFAVSHSETRIELTGVFFNIKKEGLILASTDSYRLAERKVEIDKESTITNREVIVPAKVLQELIRILSVVSEQDVTNENSNIEIYISDNQIQFSVNGIELVSRLIEGQYPDYTQIIPTTFESFAIINRAELIRAIKAAAIFSKTGINDINLDFTTDKKSVVISSTSGQAGENITNLEATVGGKDNGIVVNYRYLLDGLNNISEENIRIEVINSNTPCIIRGEKNESLVYIVMPIKQ